MVEKEYTSYPDFIVYDFEAILVPLDKHRTDNLINLSRHAPVSVVIHDTSGREPVYLVGENPERLIEWFIKVWIEKQEAVVENILK